MFTGNLRAGPPQCAVLPEDIPETFELFQGWLYSGRIENTAVHLPAEPIEYNNRAVTAAEVKTSLELIDLFCFAEKFEITHLQDQCMDTLVRFQRALNFAPYPAHIDNAYKRTREGSRLRLYLSRFWVFVTLTWVEGVPESWTAESLGNVIRDVPDIWVDTYKLTRGTAGEAVADPRLVSMTFLEQNPSKQTDLGVKYSQNMRSDCVCSYVCLGSA